MCKNSKRNKKIVIIVAVIIVLLAGICGGIFNLKNTTGSYHEIYRLLKENQKQAPKYGQLQVMDGSVNEDQSKSGDARTGEGGSEYSGTNIQTEGIDEGDVVKTDGKYIYNMDSDYGIIDIYLANNGKPKKAGQIKINSDFYGVEFSICEDRLILIAGDNRTINCRTYIITYDISNVQRPVKLASVKQSGILVTTRMDGSYVYTVTRYYPISLEEQNNPGRYIPKVGKELIESENIEIPNQNTALSFVVITGIDTNNPDRVIDKKAVLTNGDEFYMSSKSMYIIATDWTGPTGTNITRVGASEGRLEFKETGRVKGYIDSAFSMDEYKGNLRVVTTLDTRSGSSYNNVYVLNKKMKVIGSIEKLAKDELVYSARFMGDRGYFVTYRETDPLFAVDFSNPRKPKITGKLKIPGFSEYLHFYNNDTLLGIGFDGDSGNSHIKLSMYDISDPNDVKEKDVTVLDTALTAECIDNHHAVLVSEKKGIVGFSAGDYSENSYYIYKYNEDTGFKLSKTFDLGGAEYGTRGLYIDDWFYLVQPGKIEAYRLER